MAWLLITGHNKEIGDPTWTQIQETILEMDGTHSNEVELKLEDTGSLIIGGGDGKRYIVVYIPEDDSEEAYSVTLVDEALTGSDVTVTVQTPANYQARVAVQLPLVLQVVEQFYHTGNIPEDVSWEP